MAWLFLKEKSSPATWLAIFFSIAGIIWVMKGSWQSPNLKGDLLALCCGLGLSAKFVNDRAVAHRNMSHALVISGLMIAAFGIVYGQPWQLQGTDWLWMPILCVIVVPAAFILITLGPMHIQATEVGMLMLLEAALGPIWVWIWLKELPSKAAFEGGAVVILTVFTHGLIQWRRRHV